MALSHQKDLRLGNVDPAEADPAEPAEVIAPQPPAPVDPQAPTLIDPPAPTPAEPLEPPEPPVQPQVTEPAASASFVVEPATPEGTFASPTSFAIGDSGELYVGHDYGIGVARDTTGDGVYDYTRHFALDTGWVFGLDYHDGFLYAAIAGTTLRLQDLDADDIADEVVTLTEGLPHNIYGGHSNSGLAMGPDGLLYMAIGGTSDHGPELEPLGGTILAMEPSGGPPWVHASGFRNAYDLAFCPDGRLYAVDNGPDQLGDQLTFRPWDEVNLVVPGGNYGYPDYFGPVSADTGTISPMARVAPSAGITGITCYAGGAYPAEYTGDLFVTLWGSFTLPVDTGRRVMRVSFEDTPSGPTGTAVEFADGFGRPIDIIADPEGHLLVLDHERGQIFRIRYTGI